jgi:DNA modification methylase
MPEKSVQTCATSPPYWGLRDYGHDGQIGLEQTPDEYVAKMVEVFREVRRILRDDGTLWLNLGDSYAGPKGNTRGDGAGGGQARGEAMFGEAQGKAWGQAKQLVGIPWRVALALQADGWWLRQDIIWHKPNPMPESITDRCTKAHEYIFLLSKRSRYYFDSTAIMEPAKYAGTLLKASDPKTAKNAAKGVFGGTSAGFSQHDTLVGDRRNRRSVWTINTKPYAGAHFATFPEKLVEPMVLAGSSEVGCCPSCGAPWMMVLDSESNPNRPKIDFTRFDDRGVTRTTAGLDGRQGKSIKSFVGWGPTCDCPEHKPVPCLVLDPFTGSGTTGAVSLRLGRNFVGCELNPEYARLAESRILGESPPDSDESGESESESESVFDLFGNDEG